MRSQIIIIGRTHHDYQSGGEKYNYFINDYLMRKQGVNVKLDLLTEKYRSLQYSNILRILFLPFYYLYKYILIKNYVIIQYDSQRFTLFLANLLNKLTKRNLIIVMVHHLPSFNYDRLIKRRISKYFEGIQLNCANAIVCNSISTEESIRIELNNNIPVYRICPAFDCYKKPKRIKKNSDVLRLLFVGTLYERKGLEYLIRAIELIDMDNFTLDLIGSKTVNPKYVQSLESLVNSINLQSKVRFHGIVSDSELHQYYSDADIFIMPSIWEGYGMAIIEAHYNKLPVVASDIGGIVEIIKDGVNGYLVEPKNIQLLSIRILRLLKDRKLRTIMGRNGYNMIDKKYNWEKAGEMFNNVINEI